MKNKRILVTGASGGLGLGIVRKFLLEGAFVGVHYCHHYDNAERVVKEFPKQSRHFQADFSKTSDVLNLWKEFSEWAGEIDVLINNAGIVKDAALLSDLTEEAWDETFQVNVKAPFLLSQAAFSVMKKKNYGRIVNISSIGVKYSGGEKTLHYSASKAALEAITRSFAKAGAPHQVLVNALRVGVANTNIHEKVTGKDLSQRIAMIPMKRAVEPDEVANVVSFLSSEKNTYITGAIIPVSGGE